MRTTAAILAAKRCLRMKELLEPNGSVLDASNDWSRNSFLMRN